MNERNGPAEDRLRGPPASRRCSSSSRSSLIDPATSSPRAGARCPGSSCSPCPANGMRAGGIFPAIVGTFYPGRRLHRLLPAARGPGRDLSRASMPGTTGLTRMINLAIVNLAGVSVDRLRPVRVQPLRHFPATSASRSWPGALTLAIMTLPVIITATREALRAVPRSLPGGQLLARGDPLADRAPLRPALRHPGHPDRRDPEPRPGGRRDRADPLHGRGLLPAPPAAVGSSTRPWPCPTTSTSSPPRSRTSPTIRYGTALVLIALVLLMNIVGIVIRARYQKRQQMSDAAAAKIRGPGPDCPYGKVQALHGLNMDIGRERDPEHHRPCQQRQDHLPAHPEPAQRPRTPASDRPATILLDGRDISATWRPRTCASGSG